MPTEKLTWRLVRTALGPAAVVGGRNGLRRTILPGLRERELRARVRAEFPDAVEDPGAFPGPARSMARYFESGRMPGRAPRLHLEGVSGLRARVYRALLEVGAGETVTYAELARRCGRPGAHRSVGTALARNPLPLFVPCHRVVRSDGGLGGFTAEGGIDLKRAMLRLEGALD